jgi:hypothetical protein
MKSLISILGRRVLGMTLAPWHEVASLRSFSMKLFVSGLFMLFVLGSAQVHAFCIQFENFKGPVAVGPTVLRAPADLVCYYQTNENRTNGGNDEFTVVFYRLTRSPISGESSSILAHMPVKVKSNTFRDRQTLPLISQDGRIEMTFNFSNPSFVHLALQGQNYIGELKR